MFTILLLCVYVTSITGQNTKHASGNDDMKPVEDFAGLTHQDQQLLIANINRDIESLGILLKKKEDLEHHLVEHFDLIDVDDDDINLNQARSALHTIDVKKLKSYKESLQAAKTMLIRSHGKAQLDVVKEVGYLRENVNTLMEAFKENMKIAETKDHEFEEFEEVSSEVEELLIEYIDKDIEDLDKVIKHKNDLEHHIVEHFELEDVDPDDLKLKVAGGAIHSVDVEKLKHYEESLQNLKTKLTHSRGKAKSAVVNQIAYTRENAKTLFEAFQENIKIAESFDHEFEEHEESKNLVRPELNLAPQTEKEKPNVMKWSVDISYPEEVEEIRHVDPIQKFWTQQEGNMIYKPVEEIVTRHAESIESRHYENFWAKQEAHGNYKSDEGEHLDIESNQWMSGMITPSPFLAIFAILTLVLLVVVAVAANKKIYKSEGKMSRTSGGRTGRKSKHISSPELELVKEDEGWTSKSWAASSNRRRKY